MIQAPLKKSLDAFKSLKAISGGLTDKTSGTSILVEIAWLILYTSFWNGIIFPEEEKRASIVIIRNMLMLKNSPQKGFIEFTQRVLLARYHNIPFYIAAPQSTFDLSLHDGSGIPIEQRTAEEITNGFGKRTAPVGVEVYNPAFDVTPAKLIAGIVTEYGIIRAPYGKNFKEVLR